MLGCSNSFALCGSMLGKTKVCVCGRSEETKNIYLCRLIHHCFTTRILLFSTLLTASIDHLRKPSMFFSFLKEAFWWTNLNKLQCVWFCWMNSAVLFLPPTRALRLRFQTFVLISGLIHQTYLQNLNAFMVLMFKQCFLCSVLLLRLESLLFLLKEKLESHGHHMAL